MAGKSPGTGYDIRQQRFVDEYLIDLNGKAAATRAGYSPKSAVITASQLLAKPRIREQIDKVMAERSERTQITADQVVRELARVAFGNTKQIVSWGADGIILRESSELSEDEAAAVASVEETKTGLKVKQHDKVRALEALGRHLGIFEKDNKQKTPVILQLSEKDEDL